jgi:hypothetical protein
MRLLGSLFGSTGQRRPNTSRYNTLVGFSDANGALPASTMESEGSDNLVAALSYNPNVQPLVPKAGRPMIVYKNGTRVD